MSLACDTYYVVMESIFSEMRPEFGKIRRGTFSPDVTCSAHVLSPVEIQLNQLL